MRAILVLILIAAGLVIGAPAQAAAVTIDLCAKPGTLTLPGSVTAPVWGFSVCPGAASVPGPVLSVDQGDAVTLVVHNSLSVPVSLEIPGLTAAVQAPVGGTATAAFTASTAGTYLYQGTERQLAMGLYGALVVRPATPSYDRDAVLVLSAIDPAFNAAPTTADLYTYNPKYWLINGKAYPDTDPVHGVAAGTKVLLRYVNAGYDNTTMRLLGAYERVLARDAQPLADPVDVTTDTIPAGATEDALVTVPASGTRFPIYNRQLHMGMLTFLQVP
ncbi:multicopper oxidase domain-containing protein [Nonomuraea sediminis]|uniref:multicopper oxidase domain-containing protein n=1 Tax=Nonomuraea sediminis TaxID=2835864 RepID=UPI001BDCF52A|nr:multicopper oxidase domain-containing protein [Nonomuraea sediminis]